MKRKSNLRREEISYRHNHGIQEAKLHEDCGRCVKGGSKKTNEGAGTGKVKESGSSSGQIIRGTRNLRAVCRGFSSISFAGQNLETRERGRRFAGRQKNKIKWSIAICA